MVKRCCVYLGLLLLAQNVFSQDSLKTKKVKILPVPAFGYSPETRSYLGAVALFTFNLYKDSLTRISNAKLEFNYTQNKQLIVETAWNYFFKQEKWFTKGQFHYSKFPDLYYGIGSQTPNTNKLVFSSSRFIAEAFALKKIKPKVFSGINVKYINYSNLKADSLRVNFPELVGATTFGIGFSLLKDTRDNLLTPTKGVYIYGNTTYNFSESNYLEFTIDLRYYKTWKNKYTWSNRLINDINLGTPPFYDYAFLGGDKFVRGYYFGRYRNNNLSSWQSEFRLPVVWRIGLSTFGGLSAIYSKTDVPKFSRIKTNYGLGLRFLVDKKDRTNLRLDYAMGNNNNSGFYVSFGESF